MATPKEQRDARPHAIVVNAFEQRRERELARAREQSAVHEEDPPAGVAGAVVDPLGHGAPPDAPATVP